jgi:NDP-sugar pyrophosphorylase family protein
MKAMIFAAGLGTRMRPITQQLPKALVPIQGTPLLEIVIKRLKYFGINDIIINVHYLADQIETFLSENHNFGVNILISDERDKLLETGGGLKKAQWFFEDNAPFLVCNTDVLSTIDLQQLTQYHLQQHEAIATLAIQWRKTSRYLLFDSQYSLSGWLNTKNGEVKLSSHNATQLQMMAFSTFQILEPRLFQYFPKDRDVFTTIDVFLNAVQQGETIKGFLHPEDMWIDVGTPENIEAAQAVVEAMLLA